MSDLTSNKTVDRIAILVSGQGVEQLLGVPSIPSGSVDAQAEAVVKLVEQWGIAEKVSAIYFNTTASNTGAERGACVLIEEKLKKISSIQPADTMSWSLFSLQLSNLLSLPLHLGQLYFSLKDSKLAGIKLIQVPMIRPCRTK